MTTVRAPISACWSDSGKLLKGGETVTLRLKILPSGQVGSAKGTGGSSSLRSCVEREGKKAVFPKTDKGTTVDYPFVFRSEFYEAIGKLIRGKYLAGIKRCHSQVLKRYPKSQGRVLIRFRIGPTGRVTAASVKGFDSTIDSCIRGQALKWRFSAPKDKSGNATSQEVELPLLLKPGA